MNPISQSPYVQAYLKATNIRQFILPIVMPLLFLAIVFGVFIRGGSTFESFMMIIPVIIAALFLFQMAKGIISIVRALRNAKAIKAAIESLNTHGTPQGEIQLANVAIVPRTRRVNQGRNVQTLVDTWLDVAGTVTRQSAPEIPVGATLNCQTLHEHTPAMAFRNGETTASFYYLTTVGNTVTIAIKAADSEWWLASAQVTHNAVAGWQK